MTRTYSTSCIAPIYTQPWPGPPQEGPGAAQFLQLLLKGTQCVPVLRFLPLQVDFCLVWVFFRGAESFWKGSEFAPSWAQLPSTSSVLQGQSCLVSSSSCCEPQAENWI